MKRYIINTKVKVLLALLLFLPTIIFANTSIYVLEDDGLIDQRALKKINEIGQETYSKTGFKIYIYTKEQYLLENVTDAKSKFEAIKKYENNIINNLKDKYAVITISLNHTHINLLMSDDLKSIIDKDEILNDYIVPLLASKDKNSLKSKMSAAILNGYSQIADDIADKHNIELESSIGSGGKTFSTIWKMFMYTLVLSGILLYAYAVMKRKK